LILNIEKHGVEVKINPKNLTVDVNHRTYIFAGRINANLLDIFTQCNGYRIVWIMVGPGDKTVEHFSERLTEYKTSKGAVQFLYSKPLPLPLIVEIARWCYDTRNHY
jgi:hypothetical protein